MSVSTQFDLNAAQAVLKELYDGQTVENMVYRRNPFFAMVPKKTNFTGKVYPQPIIIGNSQGRSATFSNAQGNQTALSAQEFMIKRARDYSIYTIDNETMMAAGSDKGAFVDGLKVVGDGAYRSIENSIASGLFRSGTGSMGQISTITSGVVQLASPGDIVQFEVNQTLQANATDGGTPRAALGYVVAVNRAKGQFSVSASMGGAVGTPASWAANDYLLVQGDNNAKISGLAAWLPANDPTTGDNFFGVDRSVDTVRLAGLRYDGSNQSIEEAFIDASAILDREGGEPTHAFVNPLSYAAFEKSLGAKVQYVDLKLGQIGFRGIQINTPAGVVNVISDRSCQSLTGYLLTMSTWELKSLGEAPQFLTYGDGKTLRVSNADAVEGRLGMYGNLICSAPGWNAVMKLSS